ALGGWQAALRQLAPFRMTGARTFHPPAPRFVYVDPPAKLTNARQVGVAARPFLESGRFYAILLVPSDFGVGGRYTAEYFAVDQSYRDLRTFLADALSTALQRRVLDRVPPALADSDALDFAASVESRNPVKGNSLSGRAESFDSLVPIALAVILFIVSVMNASVLLQGVVEEKSSRMIEVLLSCATPRQITSGKLVGVILVALVTDTIWATALLGLMALADASTVT